MFRIRDPLGLAENDPNLKARMDFFEKVVMPVCLALIAIPFLIILSAVIYCGLLGHGQ